MGNNWIKWIRGLDSIDAEFVGLLDSSPESARKTAEANDLQIPTFTSINDALNGCQPDVLFNCTVPAAHYEINKAALLADVPILCEKPLTETTEEARQLIEMANSRNLQFVVIQNRRYSAKIRTVAELIRSGRIGPLTTLNADFYIGAHFGGFREEMQHVLLLDMAIHTFDQARYLSGSNAEFVYCHEFNPPGSWYRHGASAMAIFEMQNDQVFNYRGSWCSEGGRTDWYAEWRFIGDRGTILWDGAESIILDLVEQDDDGSRKSIREEVPLIDYPPNREGHQGVMLDFFDALETGKKPMTSADDNLHSLAMVEAAVESAEKKVRLAVGGS